MQAQTERVEAGIARLERTEVGIRQDIVRTQELLVRSVADIELEMQALKAELRLLDAELQRTVDRAKKVVGRYRGVVKGGDLARLQNRIELWAPEKRVTRDQFRKMLQDVIPASQ